MLRGVLTGLIAGLVLILSACVATQTPSVASLPVTSPLQKTSPLPTAVPLNTIPPFRQQLKPQAGQQAGENTSGKKPKTANLTDRPLALILQDTLLDSDEAIKDFVDKQTHVNSQRLNPRQRFDILVEAFRSPHILNFNYVADATYTAHETFRRREGNCLSLSALFIVMARHAGLQAGFQNVELLPSWRNDADMFVLEKHINVIVMVDGKPRTVDFLVSQPGMETSQIAIADAEAEAQYFNNLGVSALADGRIETAYQLFNRSVTLASQQAYLWANLGVALSRNQQYSDARDVYLQALALEPFNPVALGNLLILQSQQPQLADKNNPPISIALQQRANRLRQQNPYYHYWLADKALQQGRYRQAIRDMQVGIKLKPDESRFYLLLMKAGLAIGEIDFAKKNLQKAQRHSKTDRDRLIYETDYLNLRQSMKRHAQKHT